MVGEMKKERLVVGTVIIVGGFLIGGYCVLWL